MEAGTVALLISAVSLVLAGLSLGWQIAQWLLSAGRPKAVLLHGVWQGSGAYTAVVKQGGSPLDIAGLNRQGIVGPQVVGIQITNHGRAPVTVVRVTLRARGGTLSLVPLTELLGPSLPHRLEPGTNSIWYVDASNAITLAESSRDVLHQKVSGVYMTAELGTGKEIRTPQTLGA
jgi:hypothetical protein